MKKIIIASIIVIAFQFNMKAQNWPDAVTYIAAIANDSTTVKGDLANGKIINDLSWASNSSNACFTGLQFKQYMGNHVFYGTVIPPKSTITIKVTPENTEEEINIYGYMMAARMDLVPHLASCITCEADFKRDRKMKFRANTYERFMEFRNPTAKEFNIIIGVSAPKGVTERKFSIMVKTDS